MSKKLLVINPEHYMEVPFDQQLTIGRDVYNSLSLQDEEISRSHAIIFEQGPRTLIKDLASRNGVYVNGDRVTEQVIHDGDEVVLGSTIIFFNPGDGVNIEKRLSHRGRFLFEKRAAAKGVRQVEPVTVFTDSQMENVIHRLFNEPENTTFFTLTNAMALLRAFHEMGAATDARDLFRITLERAMDLVQAERGIIMEADTSKERLKVRAMVTGEEGDSSGIEISQQVLRVVLRAERCVFCPNVEADSRFGRVAAADARPIHSFIASPIMIDSNYFGFIYLDTVDEKREYNYIALRSLYLLASHLAGLLQPRPTHFAHEPASSGAGAAAH